MNPLDLKLVIILLSCFSGGAGLGILYFSALWKTVNRLSGAKHPTQLLLGSFVIRASVVLGGLYLIMDGHWERLAAAMVGFLLARKLMTYRFGEHEIQVARAVSSVSE